MSKALPLTPSLLYLFPPFPLKGFSIMCSK